MSRMSVLALAGALALGSMAIATEASARGGGHGGGGGGGWSGGGGHWSGGGGHWSGGAAHFSAAPMGGAHIAAPMGAAHIAAPMGGAHIGASGAWGGSRWAGNHGGHFVHGGRFVHDRHFHRRFVFGLGLGFGPYWDYPYYDDCWQLVHVHTPYGWHWRRVNVCYY